MRVVTISAIVGSMLATGACGDASGPDVANAGEGNRPEAAARPAPAPAALPTDAQGFVSALAAADAYEIESSRLALQRATTPGVNGMAQMLQREHSQSSAQLKAAAAKAGLEVTAGPDAEKQGMIAELKAADSASFGQKFLNQQRMTHAKTLMLIQNYQAAGDNEGLKRLATELQPRIEFHIDRLNATPK